VLKAPFRVSIAGVLVVVGLVWSAAASAAPPTTAIRYFYDADGQMKAVYAPASETALYSWDPAGNLLSIVKNSSTKLSIIELAPAQGAVGETITIDGTGFSTTASNDTVKFNGTAATVSAATAWALTVKVPTGATSGTVTVKTPTEGPVTSAQSFTVASSPAPTITSLSETVAIAGTSITISGSNFEALHAYNDVVQVNQTRAAVTSVSATSIQFKVPGATSGGHVVVRTPQGTVTGPDLYIPSEGQPASKVGATARVTLGNSTTPTIPAEKVGLVIFDGTAGQHVSVVLTTQIHGGSVSLASPEGAILGSTGISNGGMLEPILLPATGTYTLMIGASGTESGNVKVQPYSVVDVTGSLTPTSEGATKEVSITTPGQNARYTVSGTAGEQVSVTTSGPTFNGRYRLEWVNSEGHVIAEERYSERENAFFETVKFPTTGTYTLVVNPEGAATGATTLKAYLAPDVTGPITPSAEGESKTITLGAPGQKARYTFTGTTGERVSLVLSNCTINSAIIKILNSEGVLVGTEESFGESGGMLEPVTLPANGTYTILIYARGADTGSVKLSAYSVVDVTGSITPTSEGASKAVSITTPGQNARYTVSGTVGEQVSVTTSSTLFNGSYRLEWLNSEGHVIEENRYTEHESAFLETVKFPATGTYTLVVNPLGPATGSTTLKAYLAPDVTGSITPTTEGESKTVTMSIPGQNARYTFSGTMNQTVTIKVKESTVASGSVELLNSEGHSEGSSGFGTGSNASLEFTPPSTGTYTILINPSGADTGSVKLIAYLGSHPNIIVRPPASGAATRPGQVPTQGGIAGLESVLPYSTQGASASAASPISPPAGRSATSPRELAPQTARAAVLSARGGRGRAGLSGGSNTAPKVPYVRPFGPLIPEAWNPPAPGAHGRHEGWETGAQPSPWAKVASLQAPYGVTALSGQVLKLNGLPLAGVHVSLEDTTASAMTDQAGRFLLAGDLTAGHHVLIVEGDSMPGGRRYGTYEVGVQLVASRTKILEYTIWLTPLDPVGDRHVDSPTKREVSLTTPQIPGLEVKIPAGSVITDASGHVVRKLNMTAIPVDRTPFPLPPFVSTPLYFTLQPGRAYLSKGAQIVYPNVSHLPAGQRVPFWNYDADGRGWYIYGYGTVSPNDNQVVPDANVKIWELTGAMFTGSPPPPGHGSNGGPGGGDPVDLYTGLFEYHKVDMVLPDTIPIVIERSYRQADTNSYSFGIGMANVYDMRMWSVNNYHEVDLILPNGGRVHYVRTSEGEGFREAVYQTKLRGVYYGSTVKWDESVSGWDLTMTNGMTYVFGENAPLQAIRDRFGDRLTLTRENGQLGNITQITSPHGRWVTLAYDGSNRITEIKDNSGRVIKYAYNASGLLEKVTDPAERVTKYEYNASHEMSSVTDGRGKTYVETEYNANERVSKQKEGDGGVYNFAYTLNGSGNAEAVTVTDPRNIETKTTFNSEGFTTGVTQALGTAVQETTSYEPEAGTGLVLSVTDPHGRKTSYQYDSYGNVTQVTRLAGTESARTTKYAYEPGTNELIKQTDALNHSTKYEYGTKGELLNETDALGHKTSYEYNTSGQPTVVKNALGKKTTLTYELGDLTAVTDPLGRTTKQFVDALGRVGQVTSPGGQRTIYEYNADNNNTKTTDALGATTSFEYDGDGNLTATIDPNSHKSTTAYDPMDRVESETDPLEHTTGAVYDKDGNLTQITDRRGKVSKFTYDSLNRLSEAKFGVTGETAESTVTYEYDNRNRLKKIVDSTAGTYTPEYDEFNHLKSLATPGGTIGYGYDEADRRTSMTAPGQEQLKYTYDEANRLKEIKRGTQVVSLAYDEANRPTKTTLVDGVEESYGYDEANELTSIAYKKGSETLGELDYSYDPNGRREAVWGTYARTGLPAAISASSTAYNADNEQTERNGTKLGYDANGNLTSEGTTEYKWNARNQLTTISGGTTATYAYDPFGRRITRTLGGTTTQLLYDGPNVVQESRSGSAIANLLTGLSPGRMFARTTSTATENLLTDALGSTIALAGSTGHAETSYTYDPFGATTHEGTASENPFQYTGQENDSNGLYSDRARYYSPNGARFISQDPLGQYGSGTNLYIYTNNSPTNATDPSGMIATPTPSNGYPAPGGTPSTPGTPGSGGGVGAGGVSTGGSTGATGSAGSPGGGRPGGGFGPGPSACGHATKGHGLSETLCRSRRLWEVEEENRREEEEEERNRRTGPSDAGIVGCVVGGVVGGGSAAAASLGAGVGAGAVGGCFAVGVTVEVVRETW